MHAVSHNTHHCNVGKLLGSDSLVMTWSIIEQENILHRRGGFQPSWFASSSICSTTKNVCSGLVGGLIGLFSTFKEEFDETQSDETNYAKTGAGHSLMYIV